MTAPRAVKHVNDKGQVRWQPQLNDGRRLCSAFIYSPSDLRWMEPNSLPALTRFRWLAVFTSCRGESTERRRRYAEQRANAKIRELYGWEEQQ